MARIDHLVTSGTFSLDGGTWEVENNVWIIGGAEHCVVIDPAHDARAVWRTVNGRQVQAILLTHGHADHVWDTQALIEAAHAEGMLASDDSVDVPVYIPERDRYRLEEPDITTGISANGMTFTDMAGTPWRQPADIRLFPGDGFSRAVELVPGIALRAIPAPGHSEGSTLFFFEARLADNALLYEAEVIEDDPSAADEEHTYLMALDGDVIFKGSVGRTDLPGGDQVQMLGTLRFLASAIDPATVLLPGHGAVTTMEHEHHGNPYLAEAKIRGGDLKA